jgi:malonate-semialdehyde dehydrogenase (acetylating)/methylmalonate-semialdehyde dehydrogenase
MSLVAPQPDHPARGADVPRLAHWIGGKPLVGTGEVLPVTDPATGRAVTEVTLGGAAEVDAAVAAARDAWTTWRRSPLSTRTRVMFAFRELLVRHREDLARIVVREHGKVLDDALGEVQRGLEVVEFACGIPSQLKGGFSEEVSAGVDSHSVLQPVGVCAGISPFNFPVMVPMWMHPVAIACGNAFVLKPSEQDPSASQMVAELYAEAGLPDGVFNVVHGRASAVDALLTHPDVAAVSFVGSTPVARHVYTTGSAAGKRVQALGGAKNHMVVLPDADLAAAADAAVGAAYGSAGERCMAISVVVAVGDIGDPLVAAIADRARALTIGPGADPASQMGPLITAAHRDRVRSLVDAGVADGATLVVDGRKSTVDGDGFWLGPCLLDHVRPGMRVYDQEVFGPVLAVVRADSLDEALAVVAANPYGNGTAVFTRDGAAARRFAAEVEVGMVGINVPIPVPMAYYSFGGWKDSLLGGSPVHGPAGVAFYTRQKTVISRWPQPRAGPQLAFPQG